MGARLYRCICPGKPYHAKPYLADVYTLCRQCTAIYGDYEEWPVWVRLQYNSLNFGRDYEYDLTLVKPETIGKKGADVKGILDPVLGEPRGKRCPECGKPIGIKERLCKEHYIEYGKDPTKWEKYLQYLVKDDQRIIDYASEHREGAVYDETFVSKRGIERAAKEGYKTPGSYGGRTVAHTNQDEISTEAMDWFEDESSNRGTTRPIAGEIKGDRSGHKYNAMAWQGANHYKDLGVFSERDYMEETIAAKQELNQLNLRDPVSAAVLLFYGNGYNQTQIAELMNMRQPMVSEILRKAGIKRHLS